MFSHDKVIFVGYYSFISLGVIAAGALCHSEFVAFTASENPNVHHSCNLSLGRRELPQAGIAHVKHTAVYF